MTFFSKLKFSQVFSKRSIGSSTAYFSQYLHRSVLPTYHFQECLPRLPVPKLEDTAARYLKSVEALEGHPHINVYSIEDTKKLVNEFLKDEGLLNGPAIHKRLVAENKRNSHTSYISQPWFDMYLESRLPLPLNFNPFLTFKRDPQETYNEQATRSANFVIAAMKFRKTLVDQVLSPEVFYLKDTAKSPGYQQFVKYLPNVMKLRYLPMALNGAYPLDMSQFGNLFNSTRIPCKGRDVFKVYPDSRHILVIRNGHFYKVNAIDANGNSLDPWSIRASISEILDDQRPPVEDSVAYLTTADRDLWASVSLSPTFDRKRLEEMNKDAMEAVDSAIFCLVLEDTVLPKEDPNAAVDVFLHGDGASRWFDKSFSLIVTANGETGLNFEHAWGDGVAVMRFFNEVFDESTNNPAVSDDLSCVPASADGDVTRLHFQLDDYLRDSVRNAKKDYIETTSRLQVASGVLDKMNKDYLKAKKVSPDGILQLAIQAGHHRMFGHPAATYESCSTSAFKHGRTETIRSCTIEAQAAAKAIVEGRALCDNNRLESDSEYRKQVEELIRESCKKHNELTKQAAMGQGFDRHLFGLRHTAEKVMEIETPAIFKDETFKVMNHIVLSTSTLASHAVNFGGFAPVVPDGFGVGYGVRDEGLGCNITSYESRDVGQLVDAILTSLGDIYTVLEGK